MQVREGFSRDILRLLIWFPFRWLVSALPAGAGLRLMRALGDLHCYAGRGRKRLIAEKIKAHTGVGDAGAREAAKKYLENHYVDRLHIFLYPKLDSREKIAEFVTFENQEVLDEALKSGKGALIVQPHFGPVQLTLLALALNGYNPVQIGYPSDKGLSRIGRGVAFKYRLKYEALLPPILPADKFMGRAFKHLRAGGVVLTTGDGAGGGVYMGEQGTFSVLGKKRLVPLGPASWALRTGAAYIPTFIVPEGRGRFRVVFERPIMGVHGSYEDDRVHMTGRFIDAMEGYIKKHPHAWHFWDEM